MNEGMNKEEKKEYINSTSGVQEERKWEDRHRK